MTLYYTTGRSHWEEVFVTGEPGPRSCATLAFQCADGRMGFEKDLSGTTAIREFVGDAWFLARQNLPQKLSGLEKVQSILEVQGVLGAKFCSLSTPAEPLMAELQLIDAALSEMKRNSIRFRNGLPLSPVPPCRFASWVNEKAQVLRDDLNWLVQSAKLVVLWSHSDWGLFANIFTTADVDLYQHLQASTRLAGHTLCQVESESMIPTW